MNLKALPTKNRLEIVLVLLFCVIGLWMRFYNITRADFMHYDEGLYLNHNRDFLKFLTENFPNSFNGLLNAAIMWVRTSLTTTKVLWVMAADVRVFWGGFQDWFYPRIVSAVAGSLTLILTFLFARRFFSSAKTGCLSLVFLALLPSHVYYSRMALQEAFCTLFFLSGFYLYLFPTRFSIRTFLSGACFAACFLTNYRLLTIPFLVLFCEVYISWSSHKPFDIRKYTWNILTFLSLIIFVGNLDTGQNSFIILSWIIHQLQMVEGDFRVLSFLSYPYYIFRLESLFFGLLFFGNLFCVVRREWMRLFPFFMVCLQILIYSLANDQGVRYICVVTPFMAMAAASFAVYLIDKYKTVRVKIAVGLCVFMALTTFIFKSTVIARFKTDYKTSIQYLKEIDPKAKILSTQPLIQNLYTERSEVRACPVDYSKLLEYFEKDYQYLILEPQAYISWTEGAENFNPKLIGYLNFIEKHVKPIKTFPHFNKALLERFTFEHNANLKRSIAFLNATDTNYGTLRIYNVKECIDVVNQWVEARNTIRNK